MKKTPITTARRDRVICEKFLAGEPVGRLAWDYTPKGRPLMLPSEIEAILRAGLTLKLS